VNVFEFVVYFSVGFLVTALVEPCYFFIHYAASWSDHYLFAYLFINNVIKDVWHVTTMKKVTTY